MYGDGVEGWVPLVDGGSDSITFEAVDDEFFDFHRRDEVARLCSRLFTW